VAASNKLLIGYDASGSMENIPIPSFLKMAESPKKVSTAPKQEKEEKERPKLNPQDAQKQIVRIAITRADFRAEFPRFYKAFDFVDQMADEDIDTMCVAPYYDGDTKQLTGKHMFLYSPTFASEISDQQLIGVQMHELLHILLGHTTNRTPDYKSFNITSTGDAQVRDLRDQMMAQLWNVATDLAINSLIESWLRDPKGKKDLGLLPGDKDFPLDKFPKGLNAEQYMERLMKDHKQDLDDADAMQKALEQLGKAMAKAGAGDHGQWVDADGDGKVTGEPKTGKKVGKHQGTPRNENGEGDPTPGDGEPTADEIGKELGDIAKDLGISQWAGTSNATSGKYVDLSKGREVKTPGWMKKTSHASTHGYEITPQLTRKVPNRRFGMLFPGKRRLSARNKVLVAVDVSGSIDREQLNKFTEHLNNMHRFADFDLFFFNHSIINTKGGAVEPSKAESALCHWKKGMQFYVGGGTDFEPLFRFWNRVRIKYDAFFIFTDGEAGYQTPPIRNKEVNWILYNSSDWYTNNIKHGNKYPMDAKGKPGKYAASAPEPV